MMDRRTFFGTTALAAALSACDSPAAPGSASSAVPPFELDELTLADLSAGLQRRRWTSRRLTELYLSRIDALNQRGPRLGAVLEINRDALGIAEARDRERAAGKLRGALHGIPILIKDNIDTGDRMATAAGSLALEGSHAAQDSGVAARLRAAGAVLLGKTNLSEWANFRSTHSVSGWSGRGGLTRHPYALDRNPSGSSSGSAVAAAANLCAAAVGTETDGSIVSPASINGLVGIKPTVGLISRSGIIPISASQDTAGPMARTVRDAALLLSALAGPDPADPATAAAAGHIPPDYAKFLDPNGLKGARLGVARAFFAKNPPLNRYLDGCVETLKRLGAEVIDPADLPSQGKWNEPEFEVLLYEFKAGINEYLGRLGPGVHARTLGDLIAFNEDNRRREMPYFDQEIFLQAQAKGPLTDPAYLKARADCLGLTRAGGIDSVVAAHRLDAIVSLTGGPAWYTDLVNGDTDTGGCSGPPAIAGYPHVTVPAGLYHELPLGLSFFGTAWSEPVLLKLAFAWEQNNGPRPKPKFLARS